MHTTFSTLLVVALMHFHGVRSIHGYQLLSSSQSTNRNDNSSLSVSSTRTITTSRRDLLQETSTRFAVSLTTILLGFGVSPWSPASALTPSEASQAYNSYASSYDDLDGGSAANVLGIPQARSQLLAKASGKVLEIGAGTGLNLANYNIAQIESLTLLDVSQGMLEQAMNRYSDDKRWKAAVTNNDSHVAVNFVQGDATSELVQRFGTESFDTVVDSFSLCVMGTSGAQQCLDQIRMVTKPRTGKILLLENSRASNPLLGAYQDATASTAALAGGKGCVYNQNVRALIEATPRLQIVREQEYAGGLFRAFECRVVE